MLLYRGSFVSSLSPVSIGGTTIKWVTHTRLLGFTIYNRLAWAVHMSEAKKSYANKLNLLKRSRFLPNEVLNQLYFKVILPSITYGLVFRGGCSCMDTFNFIEALHCRAARIIYNLPKDLPSNEVLNSTNWETIFSHYKISYCYDCHHYHRILAKFLDLKYSFTNYTFFT